MKRNKKIISPHAKKLRLQIDKIDMRLANLIRQRIKIVDQIRIEKLKEGILFIDKTRENKIFNNYLKKLGPISSKKRIRQFVESIFKINPKY